MRPLARPFVSTACLIAACAMVCAAQTEGVHGHVFRNNDIGLTYTIPEKFSPKVENEMPAQDPSGREHFILALWNTPERTGAPQMTFLYDKKVRPAGSSREEMANRYLEAVRKLWVDVQGVKISGPKKISPAGYAIWRLDLWQPDALPHFNSAIAIPLRDRRILVIQANAASQSELDAEVDSLRDLTFDEK
jgi:hypothetical protein